MVDPNAGATVKLARRDLLMTMLAGVSTAVASIETTGDAALFDAFVGMVGIQKVLNPAYPFAPAVEVGWRLAKAFWRQGYASEAAWAVLRCAFDRLALDQVVSFTSQLNLPSQKVMQAIGMQHDPDGDFEHPRLPEGHPLRSHVLYRITRAQWLETLHG